MRFLKLFGLAIAGLLILSYFLFKPVFTQFTGWKVWPELGDPPTETVFTHPNDNIWQDVTTLLISASQRTPV